jgi:RNA polymerase sigma-70 factor, ECF subfamily
VKEDLSAGVNLHALSREEILIYLMKQFGEEIIRLVFTFIKSRPQAEDISQEVFISLYTKLDVFRGNLQYGARFTRLLLINQRFI